MSGRPGLHCRAQNNTFGEERLSNGAVCMISRRAVFWTVGGATAVFIAAPGPVMSRVEEPEYKVDRHDGSIEVRWYPPMIAAETTVHGDAKPRLARAFD